MSLRALLTAVAVAALTVFVAGCAQTSSPISPSSSASSLVGSQPLGAIHLRVVRQLARSVDGE
jgi:hypothetical protein